MRSKFFLIIPALLLSISTEISCNKGDAKKACIDATKYELCATSEADLNAKLQTSNTMREIALCSGTTRCPEYEQAFLDRINCLEENQYCASDTDKTGVNTSCSAKLPLASADCFFSSLPYSIADSCYNSHGSRSDKFKSRCRDSILSECEESDFMAMGCMFAQAINNDQNNIILNSCPTTLPVLGSGCQVADYIAAHDYSSLRAEMCNKKYTEANKQANCRSKIGGKCTEDYDFYVYAGTCINDACPAQLPADLSESCKTAMTTAGFP